MVEKYGPAEGAAQLSEAQQQEAFDSVYLPALREVTKGIFTTERLGKLVADLKAYRKDLFAAGEKTAAFHATAAINYVEREDDPPLNVFLVNLCATSLNRLDPGAEAAPDEEEPG